MIYDQYADVNGHLYDSSKFCNVVSSLPTRRGGCCSNVSKINTLQVLPYGVAALCPLDRAFFTYYSAYIKICQLEVLAIHQGLQSVSLPHCHMFEERSTQEAKGLWMMPSILKYFLPSGTMVVVKMECWLCHFI